MDIIHAGTRVYGGTVPGFIVPQANADARPLGEIFRDNVAPGDAATDAQMILIEELHAHM